MFENSENSTLDTVKMTKTDPTLRRATDEVQPIEKPSFGVMPKTPALQEIALPSPVMRGVQKPTVRSSSPKREVEAVERLYSQCRQLGVSVFLQEHTSVRSLGFTSAIHGEGKSFLAGLTAQVLAEDTKLPVTLLECNWENPSLNTSFHLAPGLGLAEWLRGECSLEEIRRPISRHLTVIPAGNGKDDSIELLQELRQRGMLHALTKPEEVLVVDLPSTVATDYGQLAARLVEELILVVRMGVTPDASVTEACSYLKDVHVHGVILNQMSGRVPRWLRQTL